MVPDGHFDIRKFNIPLPGLSTLHRSGSGHTPRSGMILLFLYAFIKLASKESKCVVANNDELLSVIVSRGMDGFGLKAGCCGDQHINELIGTTFVLSVDWIKENAIPNLSFLRDSMIRQAEPEVLTTLDKKCLYQLGSIICQMKDRHMKLYNCGRYACVRYKLALTV